MGVDTRITLPPFVRVRDVADVIGILLGNQRRQVPLGSGYSAVRVDGVQIRSYGNMSSLVECAEIQISSTHGPYTVMYHFEFEDRGNRGLMPRSRPDWLAVGVGLINFFGGEIDYNDCDDKDRDLFVPAKIQLARQSNDAVFDLVQRRKMELHPLTTSDVLAMTPYAAYDVSTNWDGLQGKD